MWNEHTDTDLWFSGLASDLGHCVGVTTEAVYLCFGPHVPYLTAITTHLHISVKYQQWISSNYTHTHTFNGPFSGTTRVSKGKTNLDFTEARDSEWQWHQLGHMQVCTSLQTDNHTSTPPLSFLQAGCPSCRPTNSSKALKATALKAIFSNYWHTIPQTSVLPSQYLLEEATKMELCVCLLPHRVQTQTTGKLWHKQQYSLSVSTSAASSRMN